MHTRYLPRASLTTKRASASSRLIRSDLSCRLESRETGVKVDMVIRLEELKSLENIPDRYLGAAMKHATYPAITSFFLLGASIMGRKTSCLTPWPSATIPYPNPASRKFSLEYSTVPLSLSLTKYMISVGLNPLTSPIELQQLPTLNNLYLLFRQTADRSAT